MGLSRYKKTITYKNIDKDYKKIFSNRFGKFGLLQTGTFNIKKPPEEKLAAIGYNTEIWGLGKRLYKISHAYYGDPQYWWLIALFNGIPTEAEIKDGQTIKIPFPLDTVLNLYGF